MKKIVAIVGALVLLSMGGVATAQNSGWIGTDWIQAGDIIRSAPLVSNLDYLFNNKVQKPLDCTGGGERLTWKDGVWQCEEYVIATIPAEEIPNNCVIAGTTVVHGSSINAYQNTSAPFGSSCVQETRTCDDGALSGSYQNTSCTVQGASSCTVTLGGLQFAGSGPATDVTVPHNGTIVAYESATVPFGGSCTQETRSCTNGSLSGSFGNSACVVESPQTCTFNGTTVNHGTDVTAYQLASVDAPNSCVSEVRTCADGALSGTFTNSACTVGPGACTSQDFTFNYTVDVSQGPFGLENRQGTSCRVDASLVPNSEVGDSLNYEFGTECLPTGSIWTEEDSNEVYAHNATCGTSGWEISSSQLGIQICRDQGKIIETYPLAQAAVEIQITDLCDCGVAATGGEYGQNLVCLGDRGIGVQGSGVGDSPVEGEGRTGSKES